VDIERLDQLMNLAGQLIINKAQFARIGERLHGVTLGKQTTHLLDGIDVALRRLLASGDDSPAGAAAPSDARQLQTELATMRSHVRRIHADLHSVGEQVRQLHAVRASINDLSEAVHQLDRVAAGIQKGVMDTRMVPIGPLFTRFKRVVRDITRVNGKDVALVIRGEKTELDKRMIDELGDPLIHMVRNAADHGIEPPGERLAAGKPRQGTITLDAFHRGNSIIIQVSDDGRGIDPARLRAKGVDKGLVSAADAERMTDHQAYQLIWEPGFSTAEKVTEISGRGMGMDIVRAKVEDLNGTVELTSTVGQGARFTVKLPLTLAILPSLLARVDGDVFAIPIESVVEIVRASAADRHSVHGRETARVRDRVISVVRLSELLTWNVPPPASIADDDRDASATRPATDVPADLHGASEGAAASVDGRAEDATLVVFGADREEMGLIVDDLLGEEDIVIKSLADNYRNVFGLAGASILGDGRVALILDPTALLSIASGRAAASQNP
jgi:two-component system chemotaxis sensor kinase CheA